MMRDYFGKEINIGDHVVIPKHGRTSIYLVDGIVIENTGKSLKVECKTKNDNKYDLRIFSSENCIVMPPNIIAY